MAFGIRGFSVLVIIMKVDDIANLNFNLVVAVTRLDSLFELLVKKGVITAEERKKLNDDSAAETLKIFVEKFGGTSHGKTDNQDNR